jgi:hypothetical protein
MIYKGLANWGARARANTHGGSIIASLHQANAGATHTDVWTIDFDLKAFDNQSERVRLFCASLLFYSDTHNAACARRKRSAVRAEREKERAILLARRQWSSVVASIAQTTRTKARPKKREKNQSLAACWLVQTAEHFQPQPLLAFQQIVFTISAPPPPLHIV